MKPNLKRNTEAQNSAHGVTRPTSIKRAALLLLLLSTINSQLSTAFAQGTAFTYQGVLSQSGAAVNGTNDLTFTLYDAGSGGNTVGTSNVVNDLLIMNGYFTVTLDFGAGAFNGSARWLQIAARPGLSLGAYTNLAPRQSITPRRMRSMRAEPVRRG